MKRVWAWWRLWLAQDGLAVLAAGLILATGLLFVYSASWRGEQTGIVGAWFSRQIVWVALGGVLASVLVVVDYRLWLRHAWWLYAGTLVLLLLVLLVGVKVYGAYRWLEVLGVQVQPSEFAKLALVLLLARLLGSPAIRPGDFATVLLALGLTVIPMALILKEPDVGTAMMFVPTVLLMLFASGGRLWHLAGLAASGLAALPLGWLAMSGYQRDRILTFLDPSRDPLDSGWNALQSAIAVGSGGLFGKGFLCGTQNVLGFLPRAVSPTDFIFPVIAEETGFIGAGVLLLLFLVLLSCYIRTAMTAEDLSGSLLALGIASLFFCHVFVNIGMTIGLLPITGVPLPMVSSGGSFMAGTLAGFGLVQSVYVRRHRREV